MNTFGRIFRIGIYGESHGPCVGVVVDGCPAGLPLGPEDFAADLARRAGAGIEGTTARKEADVPLIRGGVFNGKTTGAPIAIEFANSDVRSADYEALKDTPRPGHADLVARMKYGGFNDYRGGGHFSGRLTVALVAAGVIAKKLLRPASVEAKATEIGGAAGTWKQETGNRLHAAVKAAMEEGDSVGGVVECRVSGLPAGLGEPFFDSVESLLGHAAFSIPSVRGVEFGAGFACARMRGSECNDSMADAAGRTRTNNAGGVNGGITNGNELVFRVAVKPTSSIAKEQKTVNLKTGKPAAVSAGGRHDACIALRVAPVLEAAAAVVLADLMLMEQRIPRALR